MQLDRLSPNDRHALVRRALEEYLTHMNSLHEKYEFNEEQGKRFFRITQISWGQKSVHAFVEIDTGDLFKAASYKAPAKGARFNLVNDMDQIKKVADVYTTYLYR